ncbi:MAG: hypothetical protein JW993_09230 [Sedimentisphaerales bacterium]|nr:hypothetical protein [Sedimentisphaerales bacterium]
MTNRQKAHRLTQGELIVGLVVLAFAIAIILPMLARMGGRATRMVCGTNLAGFGKAMLIYASDYDGGLPRAGGPGSAWAARTPNWRASSQADAYGMTANQPGRASVSASLYLLVKYAEVEPKSFVCSQDGRAREFVPQRYRARGELIDYWDFGPNPPGHVSYSYHMPYGSYPLTTSSPPGLAVAADRNPWMDSPFAKARDFSLFKPNVAPYNGTTEQSRAGNSLVHQSDGQNVLFLDTHVEFAKWPNCALEEDNIYTSWDGADKARGKPAAFGSQPADPNDSLLVNDPAVAPR